MIPSSLQVGEAFEKPKTEKELRLIASDPSETHAFKVTNYTALGGLVSQLQQSIVSVEGESSRGLGYPVAGPLAFSRMPSPSLQPHPWPTSLGHSGQLLSFL